MNKKVLFISSRAIFPIIGGDQIRTAQQLEFLLQKYDVDVVYQDSSKDNDILKKYAPKVHKSTCFKISRILYYLQTLRFLFNKRPLQVNYYYNKEMKHYIDSCINEYDIVFCNNIRTAEYVRNVRGIIKVMDFVDAISMNYEKAQREAKGLKKLIYIIDFKRCKYYEQLILNSFDKCAIISDIDKQYICQNNGKDISVIGNKVDIPDKPFVSKHNTENILLFVGKMNYEPNVVAVTYFVENIFPHLLKNNPQLKFLIVGAKPDERVLKLANKNIEITGFVDSLEPYFHNATIVIAPMQTGAGIQNKIIQAMSYGCCVVTTNIGAEGLDIKQNEIAIYNSNKDMIDGINDLLNNREKRINMGLNARKYVTSHLSSSVISEQFWNFMNK